MHLIRLLLAAITVLRELQVPVNVESHRELLLAIRNEQLPFEEVEQLRQKLHHELDQAYSTTALPERPDYDAANEFLLKARRLALEDTLP